MLLLMMKILHRDCFFSHRDCRRHAIEIGRVGGSSLVEGGVQQDWPVGQTNFIRLGVAIAQWICLHLPFCHPRFESQACVYAFIIYSQICTNFAFEKNENKQKEAGVWSILKQILYVYFNEYAKSKVTVFKVNRELTSKAPPFT